MGDFMKSIFAFFILFAVSIGQNIVQAQDVSLVYESNDQYAFDLNHCADSKNVVITEKGSTLYDVYNVYAYCEVNLKGSLPTISTSNGWRAKREMYDNHWFRVDLPPEREVQSNGQSLKVRFFYANQVYNLQAYVAIQRPANIDLAGAVEVFKSINNQNLKYAVRHLKPGFLAGPKDLPLYFTGMVDGKPVFKACSKDCDNFKSVRFGRTVLSVDYDLCIHNATFKKTMLSCKVPIQKSTNPNEAFHIWTTYQKEFKLADGREAFTQLFSFHPYEFSYIIDLWLVDWESSMTPVEASKTLKKLVSEQPTIEGWYLTW